MHDSISIRRNGTTCIGARYLRTAQGGVYQSIFYQGRSRADLVAYPNFASDDPAMNAAARKLLTELVDEAIAVGHLN